MSDNKVLQCVDAGSKTVSTLLNEQCMQARNKVGNLSAKSRPAIVCLMGPTASGKTSIAIELATQAPFSIISVDSGMIYKGMDIGTAKPSKDQLKSAPHKLIDILDPGETYSVAQFCHDAGREIEDILQHNCIPLLVGGTMLYFKVLQQGISPLPGANADIRCEITSEAARIGWEKMHKRLCAIDNVAAERIAPNDSQRISRALEVYALTGKTITQMCAENPPQPSSYQFINIAIAPDDVEGSREILEKKIWQRLQLMLKQGFIDEVAALRARGDILPDMPSMRAVGYRQVWQYLDGLLNYAEMQQNIAIATRQLAKRQMTWLRNWHSAITWFSSEDRDLVEKIRTCSDISLDEKNIGF